MQTRSYPVRVRIGAPDLFSLLEWWNWHSRWSQKPVPSGVRVRISPPAPKFDVTEGAGEWSPSRLENGGLVMSQWGSIPPPSAKFAGVLLGEQPASKTGAQCSNHCTGARSSKRRRSPLRTVKKQRARRTGSHRTANAARVKRWRHWVRLPGPLPSLRAHIDCVVRGSRIFGCKADTVGRACL